MVKVISFLSLLVVLGAPLRCSKHEDTTIPLKNSLVAKVVNIADGDSFTAIFEGRSQKFRIFGIDAPEKGMPFYKVSKQKLSSLIGGQNITISIVETDRYGRHVVNVSMPDGRNAAAEMLKSGLVWHFRHYSKNPDYASFEANARQNKLGLWQDKNPSPPWKIREARRNQ